ncbi:hypothetical protein O6H91_11G087200 [Diphasiastrum complanatum]|uniref:Uncharacterized protein n=1 Tax=Diphasiastrum complanatum TaxID=34168 RepID=A0ACC2CBB3_DIPCM|nr:hypothetical protein O6H91_11G087200 [Diphasiastrum complanatum]
MDNLIEMLYEIQKEALWLRERETRAKERRNSLKQKSIQEGVQEPPVDDWIKALRRKFHTTNPKPIVVLSLFDGIGGIWAALRLLNIPFTGYSSEINPDAIQVLRERYPDIEHLGDIRKVTQDDVKQQIDLVVGGFPCQDLSCMGRRIGLHGQQSRLFFEVLRVLQTFKPKWFLVENVASMSWIDRDEISKYLKCYPIEIDSQELTPSKRKRLYWTNVPHPKSLPMIKEHHLTSLQSVLESGTALETKLGCILSNNFCPGSNVQLQRILDNETNSLRYISVAELEKVMGYPSGYTDVHFKNPVESRKHRKTRLCQQSKKLLPDTSLSIRWGLLGNSFSVAVIAYLLSPLLDHSVQQSGLEPFPFSQKLREDECAVMEPGEIWALFNAHERPNWYALIISTSGGRFSPSQTNGDRGPVDIHVRFLKLDPEYLNVENDKWNPIRGTGRYTLMPNIDAQNSWLPFSHRVISTIKLEDDYFIYPGKGQVWAVYDPKTHRPAPFFVYVLEMELHCGPGIPTKPGQEGYKAFCYLMQETVSPEIFRCTTKKLEYTDLSQFCFMVPFFYKNESGLFKLDYNAKGRKSLVDYHERQFKKHTQDLLDNMDDSV